jgi:N-acetylmuramoyl-L-alanine amidase
MKLLLLFLFLSFNGHAMVILIDPGHGGKELGAVSTIVTYDKKGKKKSKKIYEKDLVLTLAKRVQKILMRNHTVYLTRSVDRTVSLDERAEMADTVKADLFVSIHFNSSPEAKYHGFETYYLDNHNDKAIAKVESIENKGLQGEDKVINQILIDLVIDKTVGQSKKLANLIHSKVSRKIKKKYKRKDRGVKPGLFYVLALSKRPGALIEAGFMSNPKEIFKLKSPKFLQDYAEGIAAGIAQYVKTSPQRDIPLF